MKKSNGIVAAVFAALALLTHSAIADAAEIRVQSAAGFQAVMEDLAPKFERANGHKLAITFGTLGEIVKRIAGGETADVVIIPQQGIDGLVKSAKLAAGNVTVIARSGLGVAVRKGFPKPDISSPESFKRTLLTAKSITYTDPASGGASGIYVAKLLDRLGIASEMKSRTVLAANTDAMGTLIASGKADVAINQFQNFGRISGIEIIGPLPGNLQETTVFAAAIPSGAKNAGVAKAFVSFLRTPDSAKVIKAKGMDPA
jgi:molybdate transport system substrate-binding protein